MYKFGASAHPGSIEVRILMHLDCTVPRILRGYQAPPVLQFGRRESTLFVSWLKPAPLRQEPDLQEVHRLALGCVEFRMGHAGTCRHALQFTRADHRARAQTILMLKRAIEDP